MRRDELAGVGRLSLRGSLRRANPRRISARAKVLLQLAPKRDRSRSIGADAPSAPLRIPVTVAAQSPPTLTQLPR